MDKGAGKIRRSVRNLDSVPSGESDRSVGVDIRNDKSGVGKDKRRQVESKGLREDVFKKELRSIKITEGEQQALSHVRTYVAFLSCSCSGHSLVSSLLDAHKNAVFSREIKAVRLLIESGDKMGVLVRIMRRSETYTKQGRFHKGSNTSHLVPNQHNGVSERVEVIGDKHGGGTTGVLKVGRNIQVLKDVVGVPVRFIYLDRNPLDHIGAIYKGWGKTLTKRGWESISDGSVSIYLRVMNGIIKCLEALDKNEVIRIKYERLVENPTRVLTQLVEELGLNAERGYIKDCSSIIVDLRKARDYFNISGNRKRKVMNAYESVSNYF